MAWPEPMKRVQMANEVLKGAIGWRTYEVSAGYQIPQALAVGSEPSGHHLMASDSGKRLRENGAPHGTDG
jgi:hypothetical protein